MWIPCFFSFSLPEARSEATEAIPSTAKGGRRWLDYGTKLDSSGLTESDEKALTGPSRDALVLARMLGRSEGGEAAPRRGRPQWVLGRPQAAGGAVSPTFSRVTSTAVPTRRFRRTEGPVAPVVRATRENVVWRRDTS